MEATCSMRSAAAAHASGSRFRRGSCAMPACMPRAAPGRRPHAVKVSAGFDFGEQLGKLGKTVQGGLPIVGLVSRLIAPDGGGFEEQTYPEFCRQVRELVDMDFNYAVVDLERDVGDRANMRKVLLVLWMSKCGAGLIQPGVIMSAARRLAALPDLEAEMNRFEIFREEELEKWGMMERPPPNVEAICTIGLDAICSLTLDLDPGEPIPEDKHDWLIKIIKGPFVEFGADEELVKRLIATREERKDSYK